ncbi:MAG: hypothetical protein B7Y56_08140 [Gallionellales bacterium 35-53-114]|jgi:hypothetical protein|nr:MAG: hypothetical protein B7Y56_08140 [Gallionellales bacterium 35-53-114]OYZ63266.1 MAG: hypothetical protein B7Y04_10320 [Gallionellales bacterium 24-53-125]OZB08728.1 MAG: hypothetical protein B7X61_09410 [Gallionellales bacterium 39-52-133]
MWNEEIGVSEHLLRVAKGSCPILRGEVAKSFSMVFSAIRVAVIWHWILLRRQTIWMLRLGLRKIYQALAFLRKKETVACEPPLEKKLKKPDGNFHE